MILRLLIVGAICAIVGCQSSEKPAASPPSMREIGGEEPTIKGGRSPANIDADAFRCPFHPAITSNAPGVCPICGTTLYHP